MAVLPGAGSFYFEGSQTGCLLLHGFTGCPQNIRPLGDFLARRAYCSALRNTRSGTEMAVFIPKV